VRRAKGLWPRILAFDNLHLAAQRALRGKRRRPDAAAFHVELEANLLALGRELEADAYQPGDYRRFEICDPKPRVIAAAPFRDRVVHHAIIQVLEPVFERSFIHHSYACRRGRGQHAALRAVVDWARASRTLLHLDIRRYFPSIDHGLLMAELERRIGDARVLRLLGRIVAHGVEPEGDGRRPGPPRWHFPGDGLLTPLERPTGLPIGNLTSQVLANLYLDPIDHRVVDRRRAPRYLRYMDDLVICDPDVGRLRALRAELVEALAERRLRLNEGKSRVRRVEEGVTLLGFTIGPERVRLGPVAVRRSRRRFRQLQADYATGRIGWSEVAASCQAWLAHARHGDTAGLVASSLAVRPFRRAGCGSAPRAGG
jgi:RNA-directed DNA polymerase